MQYEQRMAEDLAASGLKPEDVGVRELSSAEKAATNTPFNVTGYVLPYYNLYSKPASFYRVKLFDFDPKYKQPKDTPNHVYFPKGFLEVAKNSPYILLTEGEKKAALCTKHGFPCVALGGVDSWRNRIITISGSAELHQDEKKLRAKLPAGEEVQEDFMSPLALGMQDLIDFILQQQKTLIVVYDTDNDHGTNTHVQRAAAALGYEMRFRGIPFERIRQMVLPQIKGLSKVGLDDYLIATSSTALGELIHKTMVKKSAFPRHPNVRDYLNKRLQKSKLSRKEMQNVALSILSELDTRGIRLRNQMENQTYYFDRTTHKLLKADFTGAPNDMTESTFGQYMYKEFGIGAADHRVVQWVGSMFTGEAPVEDVTPHRVFARQKFTDDNVIMQISDASYVVVDAQGLKIKDNGSDGILFESGQVQPLDKDKLIQEWEKQSKVPIQNWWMDVLNQVRLKDKDKQRAITALLFYISPWLHRWRGTQLPIEMTLGEAGSGKSTVQELRLAIQTGEPKLRNSPQDIKDWYSSVANAGGLHVTDNVQLLDRNLRQRLSDEICRIITEPNPHIEMRKYYTNADLMRIPIRCVFGITAIQQPFLNADILQRSIIIELDKSQDLINGSLSYDMNWMPTQLSRFGGREAWLAHHLLVLHRFFQLVQKEWKANYRAKHRLINFEQALTLIAKVFGIPNGWIPDYLVGATDKAVTESDWAYEGLIAFADWWRMVNKQPKGRDYPTFSVQEIVNWAMGVEDYEKCDALTNTRKLGRYLKTHKTMIASGPGIQEAGSQNNRQRYKIAIHK
jgi:hypothetical protein